MRNQLPVWSAGHSLPMSSRVGACHGRRSLPSSHTSAPASIVNVLLITQASAAGGITSRIVTRRSSPAIDLSNSDPPMELVCCKPCYAFLPTSQSAAAFETEKDSRDASRAEQQPRRSKWIPRRLSGRATTSKIREDSATPRRTCDNLDDRSGFRDAAPDQRCCRKSRSLRCQSNSQSAMWSRSALRCERAREVCQFLASLVKSPTKLSYPDLSAGPVFATRVTVYPRKHPYWSSATTAPGSSIRPLNLPDRRCATSYPYAAIR